MNIKKEAVNRLDEVYSLIMELGETNKVKNVLEKIDDIQNSIEDLEEYGEEIDG